MIAQRLFVAWILGFAQDDSTSHILHHLPNPTRTGPGAEPAANTLLIIHHIFPVTIPLHSGDSAVVTNRFAHAAVAAEAAGHAALGFLLNFELFAQLSFVVDRLDLLVGDDLLHLGHDVVFHHLDVDRFGGDAALADGVGDQARASGVADGEHLGVRGLAVVVDHQVTALDIHARGQEVEHRALADGDDDSVGVHAAAVVEENLFLFGVVALGDLRPDDLRTLGLGHLALLAEARRRLNVHRTHLRRAQIPGLEGDVHTDVAGADDDDPRALEIDFPV